MCVARQRSACAKQGCRTARTPRRTSHKHTASPPYVPACAQPGCWIGRTSCHTFRRHATAPPNAFACAWPGRWSVRTPCRTSSRHETALPNASARVWPGCQPSKTICRTSCTRSRLSHAHLVPPDVLRLSILLEFLSPPSSSIPHLHHLPHLRSFTALRKDAGLCCGSRLLEGRSVCLCWEHSKPKEPKGRISSHSSPPRISPKNKTIDH